MKKGSPQLNIGLEVSDTEAEGPGKRYAIWVQGCSFRCRGCCNPELLNFYNNDMMIDHAENVISRIEAAMKAHDIVGVSLLGGEPFLQAEGLAYIADWCQDAGLDVMVYSGFTLKQIQDRRDANWNHLLENTDLLVDGKYVQSKPDTQRRWIGSTNQKLHCLTEKYRPDDPIFYENDTIEIRLTPSLLVINGRPWGEGMV